MSQKNRYSEEDLDRMLTDIFRAETKLLRFTPPQLPAQARPVRYRGAGGKVLAAALCACLLLLTLIPAAPLLQKLHDANTSALTDVTDTWSWWTTAADTTHKLPEDTTHKMPEDTTGPIVDQHTFYLSHDALVEAYLKSTYGDGAGIYKVSLVKTLTVDIDEYPTVCGFYTLYAITFHNERRDFVNLVTIVENGFHRLVAADRTIGTASELPTMEIYAILASDADYGADFKAAYLSLFVAYATVDYGAWLKKHGYQLPLLNSVSRYVDFAEIGDDFLAIIAMQPWTYQDGVPPRYTITFLDLKSKTLLDACVTLDNSMNALPAASFPSYSPFYSEADETFYITSWPFSDGNAIMSSYQETPQETKHFCYVYALPIPGGDIRSVQSTTLSPEKRYTPVQSGYNGMERGAELSMAETEDFLAERRGATLYVINKKTGQETAVFTGRQEYGPGAKELENFGTKPFGFVDDTYLVYNIYGYEWPRGYGVYNVKTGKNYNMDGAGYTIQSVYNGMAYALYENNAEKTLFAIPLANPDKPIRIGSVTNNGYYITPKISNGILYFGDYYVDLSGFTESSIIPTIEQMAPLPVSVSYRSTTKAVYLAESGLIYIVDPQ